MLGQHFQSSDVAVDLNLPPKSVAVCRRLHIGAF